MLANTIENSLNSVQRWVERHDYKGYDPGDGLTSWLRPLTCGNLFAERVLQQAIWKSPVNLRRLVGVTPLESTKGRGFMAWGYLLRCMESGQSADRERAVLCLEWLMRNREPGQAGYCWGNHFDFTTRSGRMKAHTPTIVWSGLIGQVFLEAYEQLGDSRFLDVAESICDWIIQLPREVSSTGECLSYTALFQNSVHNSNLLGAALLARTWRHRPRDQFRDLAHNAMLYSCARQRPDGAWWYGEEEKYRWIDNFHTGYNLDSIKRYGECSGDKSFLKKLYLGYDYFKRTFFDELGRPRYYHNKTYPIDIQCAAQAIDTFSFFVEHDPDALQMAVRVAEWTIQSMQDEAGFFYYRQYPFIKARTPYFHWGQATMFKALAHLLVRIEQNSGRSSEDIVKMSGEVQETLMS